MHPWLATRANAQFPDSPPEQIKNPVPRLATRANTHSRLAKRQIRSSPTRHQSKYAVRRFVTSGNTQFAYSPPEQIRCSPIRHQWKYTVRLLATRENTRFICSSPEQIDWWFKCSTQRLITLQFSNWPPDQIHNFRSVDFGMEIMGIFACS